MPGFEPVRHDESFIDRVIVTDLAPPAMWISTDLQISLGQQGEEINVNDNLFLSGVEKLGLQKPVNVTLHPTADDRRHLEFTWTEPGQPGQAEMFVNPLRPRKKRRERAQIDLELNQDFWLGVLICSLIANGHGDAIRAEHQRRIKGSNAEPIVLMVGGILTFAAITDATTNVFLGLFAGAGLPLHARYKNNSRRDRMRLISDNQFAVNKYQNEAALLARRYPALRHMATT